MLLSIITINFNNKLGLKRTLISVANQTYNDFEYIVIDGGSTDGSVELIKEYEDKITYWISEPDRGIYHAMNKGIQKANGEYLFFLNSGDVFFDENTVKGFVNASSREDIVYGNVRIVYSEERKSIEKYPDKLSFLFFFQSGICHQCIFIKKNTFYKVGFFDENLLIVSDWKFLLLALFLYRLSYKHIDFVICDFFADGVSFNSENKNIISFEKENVLLEYFPLFYEDYKPMSFS